MTKFWPICLLATFLLAGCVSSDIQQGGAPGIGRQASSIFLAPFHNATPNPTAGRAVTDITATSLMAHGMPLVQSEAANAQAAQLIEEGKPHNMLQVAKTVNASHTLLGSVHEYRFKSDLDGAPTVGITMRLVDTLSGDTVWQATGSRSGSYYGSLSKTTQNTIDRLVREMSGQRKRRFRTERRTAVVPPTAPAPVGYGPSEGAYASPTVTTTTVDTWEQSTVLETQIPAEPEFEQIRRRIPKPTAPVVSPVLTSTNWGQSAPVPGHRHPITPPSQPQPVWTTRSN